MPPTRNERILILAKTYPYPSAKYRETSCIAGMDGDGNLIRLFPVPYRYMHGEREFQKWQYVSARISKALKDQRPESHNIDQDSIIPQEVISTRDGWADRIAALEKHVYPDPATLDSARQASSVSLGVVKPLEIKDLIISKAKNPVWTQKEQAKLEQDFLFDSVELKKHFTLRKLPFEFHYRYVCETPTGLQEFTHMITDWEAGALYWNLRRSHGANWEAPFRQRMEQEFQKERQMYFLLGTVHRFPDQWLIVAFYYPPKVTSTSPQQTTLGL